MIPKLRICKENIIIFNNDVISQKKVLESLSSCLKASGFVRDSFCKAVQDREQVFPTGLPTKPYGVAIPHTDFEHVIENSIAIGLLKNAVTFVEMGSSEGEKVNVNLVLMLAIAEKDSLIPFLRKLSTILKDQHLIKKMVMVERKNDLINLFNLEMKEIFCIDN